MRVYFPKKWEKKINPDFTPKLPELFIDFKQAASEGKNFTTLHKDDRKNLSKAISGFGNSEGGVVIWGIECSRDIDVGDVAKAKVKVKNVYFIIRPPAKKLFTL